MFIQTEQTPNPSTLKFLPGRVVMVARNDYGARLFNGDLGLCLEGANGRLQVWFEAPDGGARAFAPGALPAHANAFAITIHKSQGSEFPAVIIPVSTQHFVMLQRNLLYTGLTRGKKLVCLVGSRAPARA